MVVPLCGLDPHHYYGAIPTAVEVFQSRFLAVPISTSSRMLEHLLPMLRVTAAPRYALRIALNTQKQVPRYGTPSA
jgi:hypothetical protein